MTTENICGLCNKPEGDDPNAHICVFSCGACGEFYEENESDRDGFHLISECSAYAQEGFVERKDRIVIDTIQACGGCGNTYFIAEGVLTVNQGLIEFSCNPCRRGEN